MAIQLRKTLEIEGHIDYEGDLLSIGDTVIELRLTCVKTGGGYATVMVGTQDRVDTYYELSITDAQFADLMKLTEPT